MKKLFILLSAFSLSLSAVDLTVTPRSPWKASGEKEYSVDFDGGKSWPTLQIKPATLRPNTYYRLTFEAKDSSRGEAKTQAGFQYARNGKNATQYLQWRGNLEYTPIVLYFKTGDDARNALRQIESMEETFRELEISIGKPALSELKKEDWAESWKIHFKPIEISETLAVTPSWSEFRARPGQHVIVLDPGMSFGTGQHATTKSCLASIDRRIAELRSAGAGEIAMLDAGSGSGILAIAACKLGCTRVDAFDIDPDTVGVARENARKNGIADGELSLAAASLMEYESGIRYDIVAANILSSALLAGKEKLLSFCKPGGRLILAGILAKEYDGVKATFESTGRCTELFSIQEKEWRGGTYLVK